MLYVFLKPQSKVRDWVYLWDNTALKITKMSSSDFVSSGIWRKAYNVDGCMTPDDVFVRNKYSMDFASPQNRFYTRVLPTETEVCINDKTYRIGIPKGSNLEIIDSVSSRKLGGVRGHITWSDVSLHFICFFLCGSYIIGVVNIVITGLVFWVIHIVWNIDGELISMIPDDSGFETSFDSPGGQGVLAKVKMLYDI